MQSNFKISPKLLNIILNDNFSIPSDEYSDTSIYIGLGIEFDEHSFTFTKEPVSPGFTILSTPCTFSEPVNNTIRNECALEWDKAEEDWTIDEPIRYLGLYYKTEIKGSSDTTKYELIGVLKLVPEETVKQGEKMILGPNTIQIRLLNK